MSARTRRFLGAGAEPDPRFTLANERTFLAWIRTSLAVLAAGIAIDVFGEEALPEPWRKILAVALIAAGTIIAAAATVRWYRIEAALRARRRLPLPVLGPLLAVVILLAAIGIAILLLVIS